MSFSINTNTGMMKTNLYSNLNSHQTDKTLSSLSSGSQLGKSSYDVSGLTVSDKLLAQLSSLGQAMQNTNESIGMLQVADGAMSGISDNVDRIRVLTLQASNGTMNDSNRAIIQKEIDSLLESSDDIAKNTQYNGINLLDGSGGSSKDGTFIIQSGVDSGDSQSVTIGDAQVASLIGTIDVTTAEGREKAFESIDDALKSIGEIRSDLGASQNQLVSNAKNISISQINVASAESQISDVDFALESANLSRGNLMSQVGSFAQSQANVSASRVSSLLS